jgi:beta-glucosidase
MYPKDVKTVLDAITAVTGPTRVTHVPGATFDKEIDVAAAVAAARNADVAIVALAEWPGTEQPGNIDDLTLPAAQLRLARAIEATGTPVVLVLSEGRPRVIRDIVDGARAIVTAYQSGPYAGEAIAGVLFGDVNPSGRLPFSYPRATGAIEHYDRTFSGNASASGKDGGYNPEWPFGFGLSYTTFAYSDLRLDRASVAPNDTVGVTVTVANSGARAGKEIVQLYSRDLVASVAPSYQRLRAYQKITLAPGERRTVSFRLPVSAVAFVGRDNKWVVEPGEFDLLVGGQTVRLTVR